MEHKRSSNGFGPLLVVLGFLAGALAAAGPASAGPKDEAFTISDKKGDVGVLLPAPALPAQYPPSAATNQADLEWLKIYDEDEIGLTVEVKVVDLKGLGNPLFVFGGSFFFSVDAKLEGTQIRYSIHWYPALPGPTESPKGIESTFADLCVRLPEDQDGGPRQFSGGCYYQRVEGFINWDENTLTARLTKNALMGRDPVSDDYRLPGGVSIPIDKGKQLGSLRVRSSGNFPTFLRDDMPDEGPASTPYVFKVQSANSKIRLSAVRPAGATNPGDPFAPPGSNTVSGAISVAPGVTTLVPLRIENLNPSKRLVNLTTRLAGGVDSSKWSFQIVPTVTVPGGDGRVINFLVNASKALQHREVTHVTVIGRSLGFSDEIAAVDLTLVGSLPPSPERKVLYFHGRAVASDAATATVCSVPQFFCDNTDAWMNTLETDAESTLDNSLPLESRFFGGQIAESAATREFPLDTALARDLVLDVDKPIEATIAIDAPVAITGSLELELTAGETYVGATVVSGEFKPGGTFTLTFLPLVDATRIAVGDGPLVCRLTARFPLAGPGAAGAATGLKLVPKNSKISMPIIRDPNATLVSALPLGPAFITINPISDAQDFLNPGRTKIFNATVTNEGVQEDTVTLEVLYDDANASVAIKPGTQFNLRPGESAKVGFLVKAPMQAREGDQVHVQVNATSGQDPRVSSKLRFTAVVTTNVDIPDESAGFVTEEETANKLAAGASHKSPGPAQALLLAVLGGLCLVLRRRRTGR